MKLAAIDIGSNSIHMVITKSTPKGGIEIIDREKEMVKLGAGVFRTHQLSTRAFNAGLFTIRKYVKLADSHHVDEILAVATSATREAQNGGRFLDEVVGQTGITPRIIPGNEEARLIFLAVRNAINLRDENALVIDIGGGSVEIVVGNAREVLFGESVKLGVQRLLDFVKHDKPLSPNARKTLETHIREAAAPLLKRARKIGYSQVIGTSGTIRTLGEATLRINGAEMVRSVNAETVDARKLKRLVNKLVKMKPGEREAIPRINSERTDTIHLGGVLLLELLKLAKTDGLTLCDASLREGVVLDYLDRHPLDLRIFPAIANVRHRSVVQLARKYERDGRRENHIANLALQIFDQTRELHQLGVFERSILYYAALLNSIGQFINFKQYHKHSQYILNNAQLRGFTDEEVMLMGFVVRFHRKSEPHKRREEIEHLTKTQRKTVEILAAILRIAVGLDRGQNQLVKNIVCEIGKSEIKLIVNSDDDLELEIWGARRNKEPLGRTLNRKIVIEHAPAQTNINELTTIVFAI